MRKLISYFTQAPKKIFLVDSIGALLSAFLLFVVLKNFNEYIGMPETTLNYLSAIAAFFCFYSFSCFLFLKAGWAPFVKFIGVANLLYCALTAWCLIFYYEQLTIVGIIYFVLEMIVVCTLAYIELKVASEIMNDGATR